MIRQGVIAIAFVLAMASVAFGQTAYYVSPDGDDANPGTQEQPFKTIQYCVDQWDSTNWASCNCSGTFSEEVVINAGGPNPEQRNQIIPWDTDGDGKLWDETFVMDGQKRYNIAIAASNGTKPDNIEIAWVDFRNYEPDGGCGDGGRVHFIHMNCYGVGGCADWWIHDNSFSHMALICSAFDDYIAIQPSNAPNLVVERNRFDSIGGYIMRYIDGANINFRDNTVGMIAGGIKGWGPGLDGFQLTNNVFVCDGNGANSPTSTNCASQVAFNLSNNAQGAIIRGNYFYDCVTNIDFGTSAGFGDRDNKDHIVENNVIIRTDKVCNINSAAIVIGDASSYSNRTGDSMEVRNIVFRNNSVTYSGDVASNRGAAVRIYSGHHHDFEHNISFLNNTFKGFYNGIRFDQGFYEDSSGATRPYEYQANGIIIYNNIFSDIRNAQYTLGGSGTWTNNQLPINVTSDYNVFSTVDNFAWAGRKTLTVWQQTYSRDLHSFLCSPSLFMRRNGIQQLMPNDRCAMNAGLDLGKQVPTDIDGNYRPQGGAYDIGADEYNGRILRAKPTSTSEQSGLELAIKAYPNPISNRASVEIAVPQRGHVTVSLMNSLQKTVATIYNDDLEAGRHGIEFNASDIEAGVYVMTVSAGSSTAYEKVVIVR